MPVSASERASIFMTASSNPGSGPSSGAAMAMRLEQFAHAAGAVRDQPRKRDLDVGGLVARRTRLQRRGALVDAEPQEQIALPDRSVDARAHAFGALRQRLEIDMGGQIGLARRAQRIGEGMSGDRLQRVAQAELGVAIVDDQGRALRRACAVRVRARCCRRAIRRSSPSGAWRNAARHRRLEERHRLARHADGEIAVGADLDDALVPAVGLLDRLMDRQCIDEFVGDDDARAAGHVVERCCATCIGTSSASSRRCWTCCSAGLISTRCTTIAARKPCTTLAARSASSIKVPRPGPSSTTRTFSGAPICCQTAAIHSPINSPNIWLISGEVTKSPPAPSGSRLM